jgi:hypothetical protein
MPDDAGNMILDSSVEFMAAAAESEECVVQSILPVDGRFVCHCNCGQWDVVTESIDKGLRLARQHTDETEAA